jgi:hypothetical protein
VESWSASHVAERPGLPCNRHFPRRIFLLVAILSDILEIFTQSFCYSELIHFTAVPSHFMILSNILKIFTQSICNSEFRHFSRVHSAI